MILDRKRLIAISAILAIIILVLVLLFSHENVQPPFYKAEITAFTADTSFQPIVGVTLVMSFNVTVKNIGKNDINSANVTVQRITNGTDTLTGWVYLDNNIVDLKPNETKLIRTTLLTSVDNYNEVANSNFIATINLNDTILDERKLF